jgi:hypothetical protein
MADNAVSPTGEASKFYVYVYRDPRPGKGLSPIYVGKGSGTNLKRAHWHWLRGADNRIFERILSKIRQSGLDPIIEIDARFYKEEDALDHERKLIALFGRRNLNAGTLANLTDGGEGFSGWVATPEQRARSSARLKQFREQKWQDDPEFRAAALRNLAKGRADTSVRQKAVSGIKASKAALSADPVRLAAQNEQRGQLRKIAWENPETRQKYLDGMKVTRAARSAKMKDRWQDPEYRAEHGAKVGAATKAAWADPETRLKRIEAIRAGRRAKAQPLK